MRCSAVFDTLSTLSPPFGIDSHHMARSNTIAPALITPPPLHKHGQCQEKGRQHRAVVLRQGCAGTRLMVHQRRDTPKTGHGLVTTVTYTEGGGGSEAKKKFVYLRSTSNLGPLW